MKRILFYITVPLSFPMFVVGVILIRAAIMWKEWCEG